MYECLSGPAGRPRDWDRFRSLCAKGARFIRAGKLPDGSTGCKVMSLEEYVRGVDAWLVQNGFFEREVHRVEERFADLAHVLSAYESFRREDDASPFLRGTNSCQLLFDGARWWILTVLWQHQ